VPHPCAVCKGAVIWINERDRFQDFFHKKKKKKSQTDIHQ